MTGISFDDSLFGEPEQVDRAQVLEAIATALRQMGRDPADAWDFVKDHPPGPLDVLDVIEIVMALQDQGWDPRPEDA